MNFIVHSRNALPALFPAQAMTRRFCPSYGRMTTAGLFDWGVGSFVGTFRQACPRRIGRSARLCPINGMLNEWLTDWLNLLGGTPSFQTFGKSSRERKWRVIGVYATSRRNLEGAWPLWAGTCVTWTSAVISVGWDFASHVLQEQTREPASRENPVLVAGGRLRDFSRRDRAGVPRFASASEVLAHECGHTWQALHLGPAYLPLVGGVTLFGEGARPWNRFENEASEQGQFGGVVNRSVCGELAALLPQRDDR